MKKLSIIPISFLLIASTVLSGCVDELSDNQTDQNTVPEDLEQRALYITENLKNGNYSLVYDVFDETMKSQLPSSQLKIVWQSLLISNGELLAIEGAYLTQEFGYDIVYVACNFSEGMLDLRYVFDSEKMLAGFQYVDHQDRSSWSSPSYANPESFIETNYTFGEEPYIMSGTLTMPSGDGPFPVVLMLSGSGANDRDESIYQNKPFKDIAWGLGSEDVATFRFDKRSFLYGEELANDYNATVEEEYIEDAQAALNLLETIEGLDSSNIYLLGHSLGAMVAPEIARLDERIKGVILLAAPARDLEDTILEQYTYLYSLDGSISAQEQADLDSLTQQVDIINNGSPAFDEVLLGAYPAYWYKLHEIAPIPIAVNLTQPMLVLQGSRDYQVSPQKDFSLWQQAFENSTRVTLKLYEALNHLFIAGEGVPTNTEYSKAGHVDEQVIIDISSWIFLNDL